ncbi:two-component system regulatory protein YycI [Peribacillus kribbensis]|uniref:two-component system regulatory protein YycI n=1 Tax=Peribacillus kribbensis TaxID=356658 RepID=UPI0003FE94EB|nr:two-component system regulatory protein YycI [Peribacillus kribbensis]
MDWNKTKTIFIIVFLILDIFLAYQLIVKRISNEYDVLTESKFEDELKDNGIKYDKIPQSTLNESRTDKYIIGKSRVFKKEDLIGLKDQKLTVNQTSLYSTFKVPYKVNDPSDKQEIEKFVNENIQFGEEYSFWTYSKKTNTITFYQSYKDKPLFNNQNAEINLYLNKQNQIYAYSQTYLSSIKEFKEKEQMMPAIKAIETLFDKGMIKEKSKIVKAEQGYYMMVPLKTSSQVLTPAWQIVLDNKKDFYVNALEGQVFQVTPETN